MVVKEKLYCCRYLTSLMIDVRLCFIFRLSIYGEWFEDAEEGMKLGSFFRLQSPWADSSAKLEIGDVSPDDIVIKR